MTRNGYFCNFYFTNLIAEPTAEQGAVAEAVNDMLKATSASLLMEQVLSPRYEFTPRHTGPKPGFDYGEDGYQEGRHNLGINNHTGQIHVEINGLVTPQSLEATRSCREDLNEVVTSFLQDKTALERGLFDKENTLPEELTQLRMGKIVRERYPDLSGTDQEAIRQHAIAAMNITQQAKLALAQADNNGSGSGSAGTPPNRVRSPADHQFASSCSTPPRDDAVTFDYRALAYPDTDLHRANVAPSRAHDCRAALAMTGKSWIAALRSQ